MKAANKFKSLLQRNASGVLEGMFDTTPMVAPPSSIQYRTATRAHSDLANNRHVLEGTLAAEGIHRDFNIKGDLTKSASTTEETKGYPAKVRVTNHSPWTSTDEVQTESSSAVPERPGPNPTSPDSHPNISSTTSDGSHKSLPRVDTSEHQVSGKGQAHDPTEDTLFLSIGAGWDEPPQEEDSIPIVCESPSAAGINVYEQAYQDEIQKILEARAAQPDDNPHRPKIYLTKRVEGNKHIREHQAITDWSHSASAAASATAYAAAESAVWGFNKITEAAKSGLGLQPQDSGKQHVKDMVAEAKSKGSARHEQSKEKARQVLAEIDAVMHEVDAVRQTRKEVDKVRAEQKE